MKLSPKKYRQTLSELRKYINIIETNMCTNDYDKILFEQIPSLAHNKYRKAFKRTTNIKKIESQERIKLMERYKQYLQDLKNGNQKINTTGIQPHILIEPYTLYNSHEDETIEQQWKTIINNIKNKGTFNNSMSIVDVSGSMDGIPMLVAISLGLVVSECVNDNFKGKLITFSESPQWHHINPNDSLYNKVKVYHK